MTPVQLGRSLQLVGAGRSDRPETPSLSAMDANSSIVATSSDETIFLTSKGEVIVCRSGHEIEEDGVSYQERQYGNNSPPEVDGSYQYSWGSSSHTKRVNELQNQFSEVALNGDSNEWTSHGQIPSVEGSVSATISQWRGGECCETGPPHCYCSKGLCGGTGGNDSPNNGQVRQSLSATSGSNGNRDHDRIQSNLDEESGDWSTVDRKGKTLSKRRGVDTRVHAIDDIRINNNSDRKGNRERISNNTTAEEIGRGVLHIDTSKSNEEEEYDMVDMNGVSLGNHEHFLGVRSNSPTPVMSFDYSCYEPPTPESTKSYDDGEFVIPNSNSSPGMMNGVHMPDLKGKSSKRTNFASQATTKTKELQPHQIRPRAQTTGSQQRSRSTRSPQYGDPSFTLPGVPTFLNHLAQISITRVSAHPLGHHVLLISMEGLLFSYGSNNHGQLGLGKHSSKRSSSRKSNSFEVTVPSIVTPLLENGGKTVNCAAGIDYSLVVVRTEGERIAHRRRQHHQKKQLYNQKNSIDGIHHQMYGFGNNEHLKLGLLDPDGTRQKANSNITPRRRMHGSVREMSPSSDSPEVASPSSFFPSPSSVADDSTDGGSEMASANDVFLPRRVALHSRVRPIDSTGDSLLPGIFCVAASIDHSAALVRRPNGAVELFTWGRGEDGALGLALPAAVIENQTSLLSRHWDALCCTTDNFDDEETTTDHTDNTTNRSSVPRHIVPTPTLVSTLSSLSMSDKLDNKPGAPSRSPRNYHYFHRSGNNNNIDILAYEKSSCLLPSEYLVKVELGSSCTHVVTSTGRWLAFGSSKEGLLGLGSDISCSYVPIEVMIPMVTKDQEEKSVGVNENIASLSLGDRHGVAVTERGDAFVFGSSNHGALALGSDTHNNISILTSPRRVMLTNDSSNINIDRGLDAKPMQHIQGINPTDSTVESPSESEPVASAHAGLDLSVFITRSGSVFTCGRRSGRLGQGDVSMDVLSPNHAFGGLNLWHRATPR